MRKNFMFVFAIMCSVLTGCTASKNVETVETTTVVETTGVIVQDNEITTTISDDIDTLVDDIIEETASELGYSHEWENIEEVVEEVVDETDNTATEVSHEWENIDYSAELDIAESGRSYDEEIPFSDYALNVMSDENIVKYFENNSEHFAQFMQEGTSYSANIARIDGDFDNDGEQEYLVATNYGTGSANNVAIVDNGEVVYWAEDSDVLDAFYKIRVGEYFKADPEVLTNGVLEDYIKYTFTDYTVNEDNIFIGVRDNQREAINYYYQIIYDEADGYSIKPLKRIGWETRQFEGDDGPVILRQFIDETF